METGAYEHLINLCERRKSVRAFSDRPVPADLITRIIEIARTSPYASGKKSWEVITVTDRGAIAEAARIVGEKVRFIEQRVRPDFKQAFGEYAQNFSAFSTAPALLVPSFKIVRSVSLMSADDNDGSISLWERDTSVKSISCVCMLILLAAESLGLASCYMTGPLIAEKELTAHIAVRNGYSIGAFIPIGYSKERG